MHEDAKASRTRSAVGSPYRVHRSSTTLGAESPVMRSIFRNLLYLSLWTLGNSVLLAQRVEPAQRAEPAQHANIARTTDTSQSTPEPPAVFSLLADRVPETDLAGLWRFHPGDDSRFASPTFDDSAWPLLRSTQSWATQGYKGLSGYGWYRFHVILPRGNDSFSLILPPLNTSFQCFIDGQLRSTVGVFPPPRYLIPRAFDTLVPLSAGGRPEEETVTVALRVWHTPLVARYRGGGPVEGAPSLARAGRTDELQQLFANYTASLQQRNTNLLLIAGLDLLAALAAVTLFLLRHSEREYLWFGLALLFESLRAGLSYSMVGHTFNSTLTDFLRLALEIAAALAFLGFYKRLLSGRRDWLLRLAIALLLLELVMLSLSYLGLCTFAVDNLCDALFALPYQAWVLLLLVRRAREGMIDARLLLFPVTLSFGTASILRLATSCRQFNHPLPFDLRIPFLRTPFQIGLPDVAAIFFFLAILTILMNRFARTSREVDRTASELEAARSLQQVLIPRDLPSIPGLAIAAAYHPAQEVGGDFFHIAQHRSGETIVVLGDVSGKGLEAAMTVSLIVGALFTLVENTDSPGRILAGLNRNLHGRGFGFTTCFALRLSSAGLLTFANAGQLPPYHNGREIPMAVALPLGLDLEESYLEDTLQLAPGDRLTLLTDGVPEASSHRELFGFTRTEQLSRETPATIADAARRFGQTDDITVLAIDFVPAERACSPPQAGEPSPPGASAASLANPIT